ncbi:hypothetical protein WN48_08959 [Eufriesea mexicana]|uniref:Uncharacterized protein n=1 Tax=Eufriesea mexicana TaxID=516756 RepID=A0A310SN54_9HYME|nr:hypothetical protein WN48_08959 [Eufriesea mexicana]
MQEGDDSQAKLKPNTIFQHSQINFVKRKMEEKIGSKNQEPSPFKRVGRIHP